MILLEIWQEIKPHINFVLILTIVSFGEVIKQLWLSEKIKTFIKVLVVTLPFTVAYAYFMKTEVLETILSYLLANWLYVGIVKNVLKIFKKE